MAPNAREATVLPVVEDQTPKSLSAHSCGEFTPFCAAQEQALSKKACIASCVESERIDDGKEQPLATVPHQMNAETSRVTNDWTLSAKEVAKLRADSVPFLVTMQRRLLAAGNEACLSGHQSADESAQWNAADDLIACNKYVRTCDGDSQSVVESAESATDKLVTHNEYVCTSNDALRECRVNLVQIRKEIQEIRDKLARLDDAAPIMPPGLCDALQQFATSTQLSQYVLPELTKLPLYFGEGINEPMALWLERVTDVMKQGSTPLNAQAGLIMGRLAGDAATYAGTLSKAVQDDVYTLSNALCVKFQTASDRDCMMAKLLQRKQGEGEKVANFAHELTRLMNLT